MESITDLEPGANLHVKYKWNMFDLTARIRNNLAFKCIQHPHDILFGGCFFLLFFLQTHVTHVMSHED